MIHDMDVSIRGISFIPLKNQSFNFLQLTEASQKRTKIHSSRKKI